MATKTIIAKYTSTCCKCAANIPEGTRVHWDTKKHTVSCIFCEQKAATLSNTFPNVITPRSFPFTDIQILSENKMTFQTPKTQTIEVKDYTYYGDTMLKTQSDDQILNFIREQQTAMHDLKDIELTSSTVTKLLILHKKNIVALTNYLDKRSAK